MSRELKYIPAIGRLPFATDANRRNTKNRLSARQAKRKASLNERRYCLLESDLLTDWTYFHEPMILASSHVTNSRYFSCCTLR
jgi:hypothetical protein